MIFILNGSRYLIDYSSIKVEITLKFEKLLVSVVLKPPGDVRVKIVRETLKDVSKKNDSSTPVKKNPHTHTKNI